MRIAFPILLASLVAAGFVTSATGQAPATPASAAAAAPSPADKELIAKGEALFNQHCAGCHAPAIEGAPTRADLSTFDPQFITDTLKNGEMQPMAKDFSDADIAAVTKFLLSY